MNSIPSNVSAGIIIVGTSGTKFPDSKGIYHELRVVTSNVFWIAGASTVKSGVGFILTGSPETGPNASMRVDLLNLDLLYGAGQGASGLISFISYNY